VSYIEKVVEWLISSLNFFKHGLVGGYDGKKRELLHQVSKFPLTVVFYAGENFPDVFRNHQ
jgi:hypothetical protein